jgi:tetratricopeptide (TPR) repeat protein
MEGHSVQAVSSLKQALSIDPDNPEAKQFMKMVELDIQKAETEELLSQGKNYVKEGRYDIAVKVFEKILKIDPDHSKAKMLLETVQTELIPEIEELLEKAKKAYSDKKYHLAREYVQQILKSVPEHQEAQEIMLVLKERLTQEEFNEFLQSAQNFLREEQYETAMKALEKALKIFPQHPVALKWMENARVSSRKSQLERFRGLGNKQLELGNYGDAKESFENILKIDPGNATAKMVLARIQEKMRLEEIRRQLLNEGWRTLMMDRNFDGVIRIAEKILQLDPNNSEAKSLLSQGRKEG